MAVSLAFWSNDTSGKVKLQRKSENAVESGHTLCFLYDKETKDVDAVVEASMGDQSYR